MLYYILFPIIVLLASIVGAIAGIGGGVLIRPLLDAFGYFDTAEITSMISMFCVLIGSLTTVIKHVISKSKIENLKVGIFLGLGAAIGGLVGQVVYQLIKDNSNKQILIISQSIILIALLLFVIFYMRIFLPKGKQLAIKNLFLTTIIGLFLGIFSTFLGIGGGPINIAVLLLFFSLPMKQAAIQSLIIIIFSQCAKIIMCGIDGTFLNVFNFANLTTEADKNWWIMLLILVPISVIGSLIGSFINKKMNDKGVEYVYIITTICIIAINIYLVIYNSLILGGVVSI